MAICLLQRVSSASVSIEGQTIAQIKRGILVLAAVQRHDNQKSITRMTDRILAYRIFSDADGKMNLSVAAIGGEVLLVPQFTLAANTDKGMRPSFTNAAPPDFAAPLFESMCSYLRSQYPKSACGKFATQMAVSLVNDGPVTFLLKN